jgi:phosphinothricin acetyltransferase
MEIRPATLEDVAAMTAIYNEGIAERIATFETRPREAAEVAAWLQGGLPVLVAVRDGEIAGFARALPYAPGRDAYARVAEDSVYVGSTHRGHRVGRALLEALADAAERDGIHKLTALIFETNAPSVATHRAAGFGVVGVHRRHGRLDGEWRDVIVMERLLGDAADGLPDAPGDPSVI